MTDMRLQNLTAYACPEGNRIRLSWVNPDPAAFPGVSVVRRADTYPVSLHDGMLVAQGTDLDSGMNDAGETLYRVTDDTLQGGHHYYYTLFPYSSDPAVFVFDNRNRCAAMATSPFGFSGLMFDQLPRIYHRYDTQGAGDNPAVPESLRDAGRLRRFLELPGLILDQFYSHAGAALDLHNPYRMDGSLLPLLAQWIGWQIDFRLEIDAQRNEVRGAPHLYKTVGLIPTVEATVKRLTNWESRTKEFVHNIFLSNNPEKLNLWAMELDETEQWQQQNEPFSLHFAHEGRPAAATDSDGLLHLFYHTRRKDGWHIRQKIFSPATGWAAAEPLTDGATIDRHPAAALADTILWLFWGSFDEQNGAWSIRCRRFNGAQWSDPELFGDGSVQRRAPAATTDSSGGLWLFWREKQGAGWRLRSNRHDGSGWQLDPPPFFPDDGGLPPRVETEPFSLCLSQGGTERIVLFWSQLEAGATPGARRMTIAWRVKDSVDPHTVSDWGPIRLRPKSSPDMNESDPVCRENPDGTLSVFFSSDENGSWSIRQSRLDPATGSWSEAEQVSRSAYTERYPLVLMVNGRTTLLYRSNRNLFYNSDVFKATETIDLRYAGSVAATAGNIAKNALRGKFADFQAYTHDAGTNGVMTDRNWYSRQTLGIYLTPDTEDPGLILRNQKLLRGVLRRFLPIQTRYVFIIEPAVYRETVYTYDFPPASPSRFIGEQFSDILTTVNPEIYSGPADTYGDTIPEWRWLRARSSAYPEGGSVDFSAPPVSTRFRTWHVGVTEGEE
ncbi:MAG: hypothetical protein BM485_14700 [Desulfobulbaceae bacterium DB1]|nr:MAG: hypothetical protein BM485_14700 [Desulfobulbaceae bacterium DB1]